MRLTTELTIPESYYIEMFLKACPKWEDILTHQINNARIVRENCAISRFTIFDVSNNVQAIKTNIEVPLEMVFGKVQVPCEYIIKHIDGCKIIRPGKITLLGDCAFGVRLHFRKGVLTELEVYSIDGKGFREEDICNTNCTYILYDEASVF